MGTFYDVLKVTSNGVTYGSACFGKRHQQWRRYGVELHSFSCWCTSLPRSRCRWGTAGKGWWPHRTSRSRSEPKEIIHEKTLLLNVVTNAKYNIIYNKSAYFKKLDCRSSFKICLIFSCSWKIRFESSKFNEVHAKGASINNTTLVSWFFGPSPTSVRLKWLFYIGLHS